MVSTRNITAEAPNLDKIQSVLVITSSILSESFPTFTIVPFAEKIFSSIFFPSSNETPSLKETKLTDEDIALPLMAFFTRKDEIGIWFSNGIGHKDITRILFIENLIKMAVSYVISIAIYLWVLNLNKISKSTMYYLRWVLFVYGPLITLLVSIGIAAGVCLVSNIYLRKKSIPDVINGNW